MTAQSLVIGIRAVTLLIAALLMAPTLPRGHLARTGEDDALVRLHAEEAFAAPFTVALGVGTLCAQGAAGLVSWFLVRRIAASRDRGGTRVRCIPWRRRRLIAGLREAASLRHLIEDGPGNGAPADPRDRCTQPLDGPPGTESTARPGADRGSRRWCRNPSSRIAVMRASTSTQPRMAAHGSGMSPVVTLA